VPVLRRPDQITDRSLRVVFGGVSRDEVRAVLAETAEGYQAVFDQVGQLRTELAAISAQLVAAHDGEREATRIISRAEAEAGAIRQAARDRVAALEDEGDGRLAALRQQADAARSELKALTARCTEARARLAGVLQGEIEGLGALISGASESVDNAGPLPEPHDDERDVAPAPPIEAWSAEDIESALRAHNGHGMAADAPDAPSDSDDGFDAELEETSPARRYLRPVALTAAGLAACALVAVTAFPRGGPEPAEAASRPAAHSTVPPSAPSAHQGTGPINAAASGTAGASAAHAVPASSTAAVTLPAVSNPPATSSPAPLVMRVQAIRPCWIGITINGRKESRLLGQSEELVRESTSDIVLRVGDAGALVVFVNDQRLAPLGGEGEVVTKRITAR
jgi:hypothetical protein